MHSFGVAVRDPASGAVLGAVLMSGPPERLPIEQMRRMLPELQQVADEVAGRWVGGREERAEDGGRERKRDAGA